MKLKRKFIYPKNSKNIKKRDKRKRQKNIDIRKRNRGHYKKSTQINQSLAKNSKNNEILNLNSNLKLEKDAKIKKSIKSFKNRLYLISPFYLTKDSTFFYDIEKFSNYSLFATDLNKYKLSQNEIQYISQIIDNINNGISNNINKKSIKITDEIYNNFMKLKPIHKTLNEKELLIDSIIKENTYNSNISLRKIKDIYIHKTNQRISLSTLSHILRYSLKYKYLKTTVKPEILTNTKYQRKAFFLIRLIYQIISKGMVLVFIDESKIQLKNSNFRKWRNKNDSFNYGSNKQEKINLILAVSKDKVIHYELNKKNINTDIFENFLIKTLNKLENEEKEKTVLFMDNARPHKSKKIIKFIKENKLKVITNIPYESSFNSVELSFRFIKNLIYKKLYNSIDEIINDVKNILVSKKFTESLILQYKETLQKYIYFHNKYLNNDLNNL